MIFHRHEGTEARRHEGMSLRVCVPSCLCVFSLLLSTLFLLSGCTTPSKANIHLRKVNQDLRDQVAQLQRVHEADRAKIHGLESSAATLPTLPPDRLDRLYTVHGLRIGRLTGGADLDPKKPGDEGLKIYVVPTDQDGQDLKAAGTFTIQAFDLDEAAKSEIGRWQFDSEQSRASWYGPLLYSYVLTCPWQTPPQHRKLTIRITFQDTLTGRRFRTQKVVEIELPGQ